METPEEPEKNHYKFGLFYHHKGNPDLWVPKADGLGWTLNFANKWSYAVLFVILALIAACITGSIIQNK